MNLLSNIKKILLSVGATILATVAVVTCVCLCKKNSQKETLTKETFQTSQSLFTGESNWILYFQSVEKLNEVYEKKMETLKSDFQMEISELDACVSQMYIIIQQQLNPFSDETKAILKEVRDRFYLTYNKIAQKFFELQTDLSREHKEKLQELKEKYEVE